MFRSLLVLAGISFVLPFAFGCHGLALADDAVVVRPFAPVGRYAGHWGIDLAAEMGTAVRSIGPGTVSFAGSVAGRRSVTIDHGGGIRTSYSYLTGTAVSVGQVIVRGTVVGSSGVHDGLPAFHLSLRTGATYLDPLTLRRCSAVPEPALWLAGAVDE